VAGEQSGTAMAVPTASGVPDGLPVDSLREALPFLRRPFTPEAVRFKVQSQLGDAAGALIVAYIDARLVIERLNLVVGGEWTAHYEAMDKLMWCRLRVFDTARADVGESPKGMSKDLVSDSLKRAAVHFGVGVSIYALPQITLWVKDSKHLEVRTTKKGKVVVLTPYGHDKLREGYRAWLDRPDNNFGVPLDHGDVQGATMDEDEPDPVYVPSLPEPLMDDEAMSLKEDIRKVYGALRATNPLVVPPAQFNEWLRAAEWSHDELRKLLANLSERESRLAQATVEATS
jgi:hypothetical protein